MELSPVTVNAWSGYQGEESPRSFAWNGREIRVDRVMQTWTEEDRERTFRRTCFRILGSDGLEHTLCRHEPTRQWYYGHPS